MVTSNKDAEKIWAEICKARGVGTAVTIKDVKDNPHYSNFPDPTEKGPNDLEQRIEDLLKINLAHQNLNADLRGDIKYLQDRVNFYQIQVEQLKKENQKLRDMGKDFIDEHRNKGDM